MQPDDEQRKRIAVSRRARYGRNFEGRPQALSTLGKCRQRGSAAAPTGVRAAGDSLMSSTRLPGVMIEYRVGRSYFGISRHRARACAAIYDDAQRRSVGSGTRAAHGRRLAGRIDLTRSAEARPCMGGTRRSGRSVSTRRYFHARALVSLQEGTWTYNEIDPMWGESFV